MFGWEDAMASTCNGGMCSCGFGLAMGGMCEKPLLCDSHDDCYNGATCTALDTCDCPFGYVGIFCESLVTSMSDQVMIDKWVQPQVEAIEKCGFENPWDC